MLVREAIATRHYHAVQVTKDNIKEIRKFIGAYAIRDTPVLDDSGFVVTARKVVLYGSTVVFSVGDWVVANEEGYVEVFDDESFKYKFVTGDVAYKLKDIEVTL